MTYEQLEMSGLPSTESTEEQLRCCRRGFPASLTVLRERVRAMVTSVTCGERLQDVSARLNRAGSSVKIRPVCLPELIRDTSNEYLPTLPRWGIACHGEYGELATSERLISESGCSSSVGTPTASMTKRSAKFAKGRTPTPAEIAETFPTPLASNAIRVERYEWESLKKVGMRRMQGEYKKAGCNLSEYMAVFPTPMATGWSNSGSRKKLKKLEDEKITSEDERKKMQSGGGGKLNPTWVEWLQGVPIGWTDLEV